MERNYLRWHVARTPGPAILALEKKKKRAEFGWTKRRSRTLGLQHSQALCPLHPLGCSERAPRSEAAAESSAGFTSRAAVLCFVIRFFFFPLISDDKEIHGESSNTAEVVKLARKMQKPRPSLFYFSLGRWSSVGKFLGRTCLKINPQRLTAPLPPKKKKIDLNYRLFSKHYNFCLTEGKD